MEEVNQKFASALRVVLVIVVILFVALHMRWPQACGLTGRTVFRWDCILRVANGRKKVTWCLLIRRRCLFSRWQKSEGISM